MRTTIRTVIFQRPFILEEIGRELPAGSYEIETEEETLDSVNFLAWRRVATRIFIRPKGGSSGGVQMVVVNPANLEDALERDRSAIQ